MGQISKQSGMSSIAILLLAITVGFMAMCVVKLAPIYMDFMSMKKIVDSISEEINTERLSKKQVFSLIKKRVDVNGIRTFDYDGLVITKSKDTLDIELDYEVRQELVFNVDVVIKFYHINEINP